jgi:agmatinase
LPPPDPDQFLGITSRGVAEADVLILPLPLEMTVTYGTGTARGPRAILDASCKIELFEEETLIDFAQRPALHTFAPLAPAGDLIEYLAAVRQFVAPLRGRFVVGLGGEHTVTYGLVRGLAEDLAQTTIVHVDAHADLIDELEGRRWSHGTVMRRLWEHGCRLVQIGVRSLSRPEYELIGTGERIVTYYAHQLAERWEEMLELLRGLEGAVYLSVDVDGLDPAVIPSTGTPQPNGLTWRQAMEVIRAVAGAARCQWIGADVVEFVPSPHPPGCDLTAARLVMKMLAWRTLGASGSCKR